MAARLEARLAHLKARATGSDEDLLLQVGAVGRHRIYHVGNGACIGADDSLARSRLQTVLKVVLAQHEGRRHQHCANLVQREGREPELIVAAQDDQHHVALADTLRHQEVCALVAPELHLAEAEAMLLPLGIAPHHGGAVGIVDGYVVYDVISPAKVLVIVQ